MIHGGTMATLEELANKGFTKYSAKLDIMKTNYEAAKDIAIKGYEATPFGPKRKAHYKRAWDEYAIPNYKKEVNEKAAEKWRSEWVRAMSE